MPFPGSLFLTFLHPLTLVVIAVGVNVLIAGWKWPPPPVLAAWVLAPLFLNSVIWFVGLPLFGWRFEDLGIIILFGFILPLNGVLFGLALTPVLWRWLAKYPAPEAIGVGVQLVILVVNMAVLGQFDIYANIAGYRPAEVLVSPERTPSPDPFRELFGDSVQRAR